MNKTRLLITGSEGYLGTELVSALAQQCELTCIDILPAPRAPHSAVYYQQLDIRSPQLATLIQQRGIQQVVHLASVMSPGNDPQRDYDIDVNGTRNLLNACHQHAIRHVLVTSSGAAYGYHADNPSWLTESDPLRGNAEFSYSYHKRLIEELLAAARVQNPSMQQLILRPGTVLGARTDNMITRLFTRRRLLKVMGSDSPFVFIWDQDVIAIMLQGIERQQSGIFNLAGDGALTVRDIANLLHKPVLNLPAPVLKTALMLGKLSGLSPYGPEQLDFLRYRPVLANTALKQQFGYTPQKTSAEVFEYYARARGLIV